MVQITQTVPSRIFQLLRSGQELTRQEISGTLSLSMPTTLQYVTELMEAGILEERGTAQSNGTSRSGTTGFTRAWSVFWRNTS